MPADYDGDGATDFAVFRPGRRVVPPGLRNRHDDQPPLGPSRDVPVPADYHGDGRADTAVYRPSSGTWYVIRSSTGATYGVQWGTQADVPTRVVR